MNAIMPTAGTVRAAVLPAAVASALTCGGRRWVGEYFGRACRALVEDIVLPSYGGLDSVASMRYRTSMPNWLPGSPPSSHDLLDLRAQFAQGAVYWAFQSTLWYA